jgi:hypothetical protein
MTRAVAAIALALTLAACAGGSSGSPVPDAKDQGIRGVVLAGPQCPVETAESPCPDRPLPGVRVEIRRGGDTVVRARSDDEGRFAVVVPPGTYAVRAPIGQDGFMSSQPVAVEVRPGAYTDVTVSVDTGIR